MKYRLKLNQPNGRTLYLRKTGWTEHEFEAKRMEHREAMDIYDYLRKNGHPVELEEC